MEDSIFDLEHLSQTFFKLTVPVVLGMAVTLIYNLADTFFISQTGNLDLIAGVSLCSPLFTTLMAFGNIYGQGGSSLLSRLLGSKDGESCKRISAFCFYIAIATGLVLLVLFLAFRTKLLYLIGADEATFTHANAYYTWIVLGAPFIVLNFIHMNLLRCEGMATQSMIGTITGSVVNIILDPIFISVLGMGAMGAAVATVIGYIVSDAYLLYCAWTKSQFLSVDVKKAHVSVDEMKQIFGIGFSAAVTNLMSSLCVILLNTKLLTYGNDKIAAMGIVSRINMIAQLVLVGFAFGSVPLFGYLYGSDNKEKLKELMSFIIKFLGGLALALSAILFLLAPIFMGIFVKDVDVIATGSTMLRFQTVSSVFVAVVLLMTVLFQATGKVVPSFMCSLSRQGVVYIIVLYILSAVLGYTGVIAAQCTADIVSAFMAVILYQIYMK